MTDQNCRYPLKLRQLPTLPALLSYGNRLNGSRKATSDAAGARAVRQLDEILGLVLRSIEPCARSDLIKYVASSSHAAESLEHLIVRDPFAPLSSNVSPLRAQSMLTSKANAFLVRTPNPWRAPPYVVNELNPPTVAIPNGGSDSATKALSNAPNVQFNAVPFSAIKSRKPFTVKHYTDAAPSMHCHVCCRSAKNVKVHACAKIREGICRKVVCVRCFAEQNWVFEEGWICCHCRGICTYRPFRQEPFGGGLASAWPTFVRLVLLR